MSQNANNQTIQIQSIILTAEDLAITDQILGNLAYKTVDPIYQILKKRMEEAAQKLLAEATLAEQAKMAALQQVKEVAETEVDA